MATFVGQNALTKMEEILNYFMKKTLIWKKMEYKLCWFICF